MSDGDKDTVFDCSVVSELLSEAVGVLDKDSSEEKDVDFDFEEVGDRDFVFDSSFVSDKLMEFLDFDFDLGSVCVKVAFEIELVGSLERDMD